jgi:hypothetical protein
VGCLTAALLSSAIMNPSWQVLRGHYYQRINWSWTNSHAIVDVPTFPYSQGRVLTIQNSGTSNLLMMGEGGVDNRDEY